MMNAAMMDEKPKTEREWVFFSFRIHHSSLIICFFIVLLGLAGCNGGTQQNTNSGSQATPAATVSPSPQSSVSQQPFDGERAFEHVRKQVELGPRPAGSAELARARDYITGELKSYGLNVNLDEFTATTPVGKKKMVN